MKNKKGFTLIELLATIVILGIILLIVVPKISNVITNARKGAFKSTNAMIVTELNRENGLEIIPQVYTFTDGVVSPEIEITGELPTSGTIEINELGQTQVVTNDGTYCAIKRFDEDTIEIFDVGEILCNVVPEITLTVNPNGGTYESFTENTTYQVVPDNTKDISDPTRENYTFDGWVLTGGGTFEGTTFTAGLENATLSASWTIWPALTVNLNSGTTIQDFNEYYLPSTSILLEAPYKSGYVFLGWNVNGEGSNLNNNILTIGTEDTILMANWLAYEDMYTYTGISTVINDGNGDWRIKFLSSGTFKPLVDMTIDVFLVGGGGGGQTGSSDGRYGAGGGGGYTGTWASISLTANTNYSIIVGAGGVVDSSAGGGSSSAFGHSVNGGRTDTSNYYKNGGNGGSGGGGGGRTFYGTKYGGTNGSNGAAGEGPGGTGQGSTTREFAESTGQLYSKGGDGGYNSSVEANTGYGGNGGVNHTGYAGATGIVVIRNNVIKQVGLSQIYKFSYSGTAEIIDGNTDNWKIKFLSSGTFKSLNNMTIDVFLVGGGGGGQTGSSDGRYGAGGGGGYTGTWTNISLIADTSYSIVVGAGGVVDSSAGGGSSSAFGHSVNGGCTDTSNYYKNGGNGGSGGGGGGRTFYGTKYGGTNGANGAAGEGSGGIGQGSTTREFGESTGQLYSKGGDGGYNSPVVANTGYGGNGGVNHTGYAGATGIVIIRTS